MHAYPDTVGAGRTGEMSKVAPILARLCKRPASRMPERSIFGRWPKRTASRSLGQLQMRAAKLRQQASVEDVAYRAARSLDRALFQKLSES